MLREPFFYILRRWTVDNFSKAMFNDVAERNLSAMVKATGDSAAVMENCDVRV